jgi:aubergine-like protein
MEAKQQSQANDANDMERKAFLNEANNYDYPSTPKKNENLRNETQVQIISNLFPIEYVDSIHKMFLYSIEILPTIADDNYPLKRVIYQRIESQLPPEFKKVIFAGNNLYACITNSSNKDLSVIEFSITIKEEYSLKLRQVKEISFTDLQNNTDKEDKEIKHIIEKLIRYVIMRNPNVIKFKDGTMINKDDQNITSVSESENSLEKIYKGYMTSVQITQNGFYMRINDVSKIISGKSAYRKIMEIRDNNTDKGNLEIREMINDYFRTHRTVLAKYGNLRTYKINTINFDKTPNNTSITIKDINGNSSSVSLVNYYRNQYGLKIKDDSQPLIEVERIKKIGEEEEKEIVYLIPELVYLTGLEDTNTNNDNTRRKITTKTKMKPVDKINAINGINRLINSNINKKYKNREGKEITLKSAKEVIDLYGINIGKNLLLKGRILTQPHLIFNHGQKFIIPNNGNFRSEFPNKVITFTNENLFYVYDMKEKNDCVTIFKNIMVKCRGKKFAFSDNFNPENVVGYGIKRTNTWGDISAELKKIIPSSHQHKFGFVFLSRNFEKHYGELKNYFVNQLYLITQFGITRKLLDVKRGNTMQFNLIEQFNIKIGGENHYINFVKENLMKESDVYLVIGLKSQVNRKTGKIKFCMTSTKNRFLNCINTSMKECDNNKQKRQELLQNMFKDAIKNLMKFSPKAPNYIILYRRGGNAMDNLKLAIDEKDIFINVIKELESSQNKGTEVKIPFYYICCNLKCDMKFFEYSDNKGTKTFGNPKSGLIIDESVTQKNKFEFYIQPQFVNQGTATPSHYQVMCTYQHSDDILKLEQLEKITFYLCYYYFTWSGAIREPGILKMTETALDFSGKCFGENNMLNYFFPTPIYV